MLARSEDGKPPGFSYVDRGKYLEQLRPIAESHGRQRLHVVLMDELTADHRATLGSVFTFLEIDPSPAHTIGMKVANTFGGGEASRQGEARERKQRDRGLLPTGEYPPMDPDTRKQLRAQFGPLNAELSEWLGRDLSHWT